MPELKLDILPSVKHVIVLLDDAFGRSLIGNFGNLGNIRTGAEGRCLSRCVNTVAMHQHLEGRSGWHN